MSKRPVETCRLCHEEKKLCFSHVIPEFMHLEMYDEKHRALKVESDPDSGEKFLQKGEREFLFCDDCEGRLGKFETYASPIIKSLFALEVEEEDDSYIVRDINYQSFKLFQMSLLWRASVASIDMFGNITLGGHEDRLRKMLLSEDPGPTDHYGCVMFAMQKTKYLHRMIWSPETDQIDGLPVYRFQTGRLFWYFFLPNEIPADAASQFLTDSGILRILKAPWNEDVVIQRLAGRIAEARKKSAGHGG